MEARTTDTTSVDKSEKRVTGPYVPGVFNPSFTEFQHILDRSSRSILDIGCGKDPRLSWWLGSHDLWVGCDPEVKNDGPTITVHRSVHVSPGARLVVFPSIVASVPNFHPDVLSAVAPNQRDVSEGRIFNSELDRFLDPRKTQVFVIALDKRTREYLAYQDEAKGAISEWMEKNRFQRDPDNSILADFHPNSRDLGAARVIGCFVRNG